uniref:Uncharacterized protein n=1 Tax=Triticum urartu TaxID=4572 RepID=A0A8R7P9Y7_TRIUA
SQHFASGTRRKLNRAREIDLATCRGGEVACSQPCCSRPCCYVRGRWWWSEKTHLKLTHTQHLGHAIQGAEDLALDHASLRILVLFLRVLVRDLVRLARLEQFVQFRTTGRIVGPARSS